MATILLSLLTLSAWCQVAVRVYAALWLLSGLAWGAWRVLALDAWIPPLPYWMNLYRYFLQSLEKRAVKTFPHAQLLDEQDT